MAVIVREPKIGQLVYPAYSPREAGVIRAIVAPERPERVGEGPLVDVRTLKNPKGPDLRCRASDLRDFQSLIDDHKKKYENHLTRARLLKELGVHLR